jgi:hypothetical protein
MRFFFGLGIRQVPPPPEPKGVRSKKVWESCFGPKTISNKTESVESSIVTNLQRIIQDSQKEVSFHCAQL